MLFGGVAFLAGFPSFQDLLVFHPVGVVLEVFDLGLDFLLQHSVWCFYLKGALFENLIVLEMLKQRFYNGIPQDIWFFRDSNHTEVDVVSE